MAVEVKGLSDVLRDAKGILQQVNVAKDRLETHVGELSDALTQVNAFTNQVQKATSEMRAVLGAMTNGAPSDEPADPPTPLKSGDTTWTG